MTQSEMFFASFLRPSSYFELDAETQSSIDKSLGILDWDGSGANGTMTLEERERFEAHYDYFTKKKKQSNTPKTEPKIAPKMFPNKVRISFELDLTNHPGYCPDGKDDLNGALQNIGSWLGGLRHVYLEESIRWLTDKECDSEMAKLMHEHAKRNADLAKQIFNQYQVEGALADGTQFTFTHNAAYEEFVSFSDEPGPREV